MSLHFPALEAAHPSSYALSASFLKKVSVVLYAPDGSSCPVTISPNATRIQLLAYLAWKRRETVSRREIERRVLRHGMTREEATPKKLRDKFGAHVRLVERDIQNALIKLHAATGTPLPTGKLEPFVHEQGIWRLSSLWLMTDLDRLETYAQVLDKHGDRFLSLSKAEYDAIISSYPGDFLQETLERYPEEFRPINKRSWIIDPYAHYRKYYLRALLYAGNYEWQIARMSEESEQWSHYEQAISLHRRFAIETHTGLPDIMVPLNTSLFSLEYLASFSEEVLHNCLDAYKATGRQSEFDQCYREYAEQMKRLSKGTWKPGQVLREIVPKRNW